MIIKGEKIKKTTVFIGITVVAILIVIVIFYNLCNYDNYDKVLSTEKIENNIGFDSKIPSEDILEKNNTTEEATNNNNVNYENGVSVNESNNGVISLKNEMKAPEKQYIPKNGSYEQNSNNIVDSNISVPEADDQQENKNDIKENNNKNNIVAPSEDSSNNGDEKNNDNINDNNEEESEDIELPLVMID